MVSGSLAARRGSGRWGGVRRRRPIMTGCITVITTTREVFINGVANSSRYEESRFGHIDGARRACSRVGNKLDWVLDNCSFHGWGTYGPRLQTGGQSAVLYIRKDKRTSIATTGTLQRQGRSGHHCANRIRNPEPGRRYLPVRVAVTSADEPSHNELLYQLPVFVCPRNIETKQ